MKEVGRAMGVRPNEDKDMRVKEVAKLANVSVRTLHHYDEIGLLSPDRSEAGYRDYSPADLERLQQILIGRALGLSLESIRASLEDPAYDRRKQLLEQKAKLEAERARLSTMLRAVEAALEGKSMSEQFKDFDHHDHEQEAAERWGETDAYKESARRTKGYGKKEFDQIKQEVAAINDAFAERMDANVPAKDAADIAERHREHIERWFYPCTRAFHVQVSQMYTADERFKANYDRVREGLAAYVQAAIAANAERTP